MMLDGQESNHIFGNQDTLKCFICGKRGKDLMKSEISIPINTERLDDSLRPLHSMLRMFGKLLSIRYKKGMFTEKKATVHPNIHKWMVEQNKIIHRTTKLEVHKQFWDELKLDVDRPKQGFGTITS